MKKIFVAYLVYFDRARRYVSIIQTLLVLVVTLKVFNLPQIWYYVAVPVIFVLAIFIGYIDTKLGIRSAEMTNLNLQNPELMKILNDLDAINKKLKL